MKLSRESIQRMISQKPGTSNVTVINQEGGGGVTLGPLLTSLNSEAMPTAEGYLHWTGSDWDFTSIDLSSYATEAWVLQQGYVTSSAISDMATETWVLQQGYITASAVSDEWKVKDVEVVADNGLVLNGEDVIYDAVLASNGMLTLKSTRLSIAVPKYTSDLVNDSGFIDQTGGVVDGLTVTNDLDAGLITVGSLVNSNTMAEYLDSDAMQTWLQQQGYITQTTADGRYIKGVSVYGSSLNPDTNRVVNIPYAGINTPGVIQIGTGLLNDEGHTSVDTTVIASREWADGRYLPLTGGSLSNDLTIASNKYLRFGSNSGGLLIHNTTNGNNSLDISANRINLNVENRLFYNGEEVSTHSAIQNEFVAKAGSSMTGALSMGNGVNVNFGDCAVTSNGSAQGNIQAGKILKLMGNYVAVTAGDNADANFTVNGNILATRPWVTTQLGGYLPLSAGGGKPLTSTLYITTGYGISASDGNGLLVYKPATTWGGIDSTQWGIGAINCQGVIRTSDTDLIHYRGSNNKKYKIWDAYNFNPDNYLLLSGGKMTGNIIMAGAVGTTISDSAKIEFKTYVSNDNPYYAPYIQAIHEASYGRKRLSVFQKNVADWDTPQVEVFTIKPNGNVGIGTTTPQAKLDVNGNVRISGTLTGVTNIDGLMIFDSTNNKVTVGTLDVTTLGMTSISVGENGYKMSISSNDNAVTFNVEDVGDYVFGYGNSRGNIYAGDGDFTGNVGIGTAATSSYKLKVQGASLLNGLVGIGTAPVPGHALDVDGDVYVSGDVIANNVPRGSDIRMKNVRRYLEPSVRDVAFAPIIEFDWKDGFGGQNASHSVGSIAQYWQTVFPQAVREGKDGMLCLEYGAVALVSAITAARSCVDNERRIAELEQRVAELEDKLAAMVSQQSETTEN